MAGCSGDFPRDADGTLDRVRSSHGFRVGLVAPLGESGLDPKVESFLHRVGRASGASARPERGDAEPLLKRLEEGELDLVIGRFDKKSPWGPLVTIGPPLRVERQGRAELHLAPVMQNGENGWIALVEREARNVAPEAQ